MAIKLPWFADVPLPCTNDSISKVILDCLSDFDVDNKLSTITVDSYTSDDELIDILVDKLLENKLLFKGNLFRLPCFAHTMRLMVQDAFDVIKDVIEKIRDSIVFWTSSLEREMTLEKAVCELGVSTITKLVLDNRLSWSSTYLMVQESFVLKDVFSHLGQQESQYDSLPTKEEWDLAREVCNRLKYLYNEMKDLADSPACNYLMAICGIKVKLLEWLNCEIPEIKEMASKMVEKFGKYWFAARDILGVATVFHPEVRFFSMKHYFPKIYGNEVESEVDRIRQIFYDLFKEYKNSLPVDETNTDDSHLPMSNFRRQFKQYLKEQGKDKPDPCEVDSYLKQYFSPDTEDIDTLTWWEENKTRFPILHKMAKDILGIPIFSVDAENAFDVGDRILGENRSRLHPTMVEALMCTQRWLRGHKHAKSEGKPTKLTRSEVSSSASNLHSLGTIYDDANAERGIVFKRRYCVLCSSAKRLSYEETAKDVSNTDAFFFCSAACAKHNLSFLKEFIPFTHNALAVAHRALPVAVSKLG
ncbi:zinc finger BED domain-containing protein RICESLEEPER 2-like [Spinacia oleracea]|uniref:Zinc finger BED domain-containing protein RICESLEEPER 2-like n=1 Tax=Spinacia oleracea TaxID=3562 RepID=A0ABM3R8V6_SPIOL|nr:zinc finger BED domain-containing protein RICESLEEPER 2-like [Spinacia oleracea]